jgi:hypothetical protein
VFLEASGGEIDQLASVAETTTPAAVGESTEFTGEPAQRDKPAC